MPRMLRSPRTWRSSPQPTVLLAPSRRTRRTWCWTSPLISRRERLVRAIVDLIHSSTSSLDQHRLTRARTVGGPHAPIRSSRQNPEWLRDLSTSKTPALTRRYLKELPAAGKKPTAAPKVSEALQTPVLLQMQSRGPAYRRPALPRRKGKFVCLTVASGDCGGDPHDSWR